MTSFWIAAAAMAVVAIGFIALPFWRHRSAGSASALVGLSTVVLVLPLAIFSYLHVSTWNGEAPRPQMDPESLAMVEQLAEIMQANPQNIEGWLMLGRGYYSLGRYADARDAFIEAYERVATPGTEIKLLLAVSMIQADSSTLATTAGPLLEQVLEAEPRNPDALWFGGFAAQQRGRADLAAQRWSTLLSMLPPDATEQIDILESQIAMLANEASITGAQMPPAAEVASDGPTISVRVSVDESLSTEQLGPNARLFIFARRAEGGPPLAAVNRPLSSVPGVFTLTGADSPMGGGLPESGEVTLVARLSASGNAAEASGDLFAQTVHRMDSDTIVDLTINQVVP